MNQEQESATVADRSTEFVAVEGGQDTSSAGGLLTAAYVVMWLAIFGFVWLTSRRLSQMQRRVEELEGALKKADDASRGSA
jgi:CcmD family protein